MNNYRGTATLTNCTVDGNFTWAAAAVGQPSGTATLTNCTVSGNSAPGTRRWRPVICSRTTTLTNCTVSDNSAGHSLVAGWSSFLGTTTLTGCTLSGNTANIGARAGEQLWHGHADQLHRQPQLCRRRQRGRRCSTRRAVTLNLAHVVVANNSASADSAGNYGSGGGIENDGSLTVTQSLFTNNLASGGEYAAPITGPITEGSAGGAIDSQGLC